MHFTLGVGVYHLVKWKKMQNETLKPTNALHIQQYISLECRFQC